MQLFSLNLPQMACSLMLPPLGGFTHSLSAGRPCGLEGRKLGCGMQVSSEGAGVDALGGKRHSGNRVVPRRDAECKDLSTVDSHLGPPSNLPLASFPNLLTFFS